VYIIIEFFLLLEKIIQRTKTAGQKDSISFGVTAQVPASPAGVMQSIIISLAEPTDWLPGPIPDFCTDHHHPSRRRRPRGNSTQTGPQSPCHPSPTRFPSSDAALSLATSPCRQNFRRLVSIGQSSGPRARRRGARRGGGRGESISRAHRIILARADCRPAEFRCLSVHPRYRKFPPIRPPS
jgi:hypothetical protein